MAYTVSLDAESDSLSSLVARAEAGEEVTITREGVRVARLVPAPEPRPADDWRDLTPDQERAWEETLAFIATLKPVDPPSEWPRNRDELYDDVLRERGLLPR